MCGNSEVYVAKDKLNISQSLSNILFVVVSVNTKLTTQTGEAE